MRRSALTLAALLSIAPAADARTRAPKITAIRCVPPGAASCASGVTVTTGRLIQLRGERFKRDMRVTFRWDAGALATTLKNTKAGWTARVPAGVRPGAVRVYLRDRANRRSNAVRIKVVRSGPTPVKAAPIGDLPGEFGGHGMWIWELPNTEGGDVDRIIARAQKAGMQTVFIKGADGGDTWKQFTPALVQQLQAAGLRVCAWQFVYGTNPTAEANAAAAVIKRGAQCFVIDAETRYEKRYAAAATYITKLRAAIGPNYPLGLTSFPYVDYHPWLPYSVFLGPGAAQVNQPQVYWKDIGTTVDAASSHTFAANRVYRRPIAPLGQTYQKPSGADLRRFRAVWSAYGSGGLSWWDWQETTDAAWLVLAEAAPAPAPLEDPGWPALGKGSKGDQVIWLEQHLQSVDPEVGVDGRLDADDVVALQSFQTSKGLPPTGRMDAATWESLLAIAPAAVDWTQRPSPAGSSTRTAPVAEIPQLGQG